MEAGLRNPDQKVDSLYLPNEIFPTSALKEVPELKEFITKRYFEIQKQEQRNIVDVMLMDPNRRNTNDVQTLIRGYFLAHFDGEFKQYTTDPRFFS